MIRLIAVLSLFFSHFVFAIHLNPQINQDESAQAQYKAIPDVAEDENTQVISLRLFSLEMKGLSELWHDELYITVTAYPSSAKSTHIRIPQYPRYWLSSHVDQISDLEIYKSHIKAGEGVTLFVSLIEHDFPPANNDDQIEQFKIRIDNKDGVLKEKWSIPNSKVAIEEVETKNGLAKQLELTGANAHYTALLMIKSPSSSENEEG